MKKILIAFMSIILMLSLFSCKGNENSNSEENGNTQSSIKLPWGNNGNGIELPEDEF